jgi:hypothetical protein
MLDHAGPRSPLRVEAPQDVASRAPQRLLIRVAHNAVETSHDR